MNTKEILSNCNLCIRKCGTNRYENLGFCKSSDILKVSKAQLHFWEEPCISGENGSGTVFFSNCNLSCVFCQNHFISQEGNGQNITTKKLSEIFLNLQSKGANNINLVTPTHYVPQIIESLDIAKKNGLTIPIIYNTNGYDSIETIRLLKGYIDVYLPDYKYFNDKYSVKYSNAKNYNINVKNIIHEMIHQVGKPIFDNNRLIKKGVIIRHLMLPGLLFDSKKVIDDIYTTFNNNVYISIMNQYTPMNRAKNYPEINKFLNPKHYDSLIDYALSIGVTQGFIQDNGTNSESYVPDFNNKETF